MAQKILIVEDERELADIMVSYLKVEGFEAFAAYDGEWGLQRFSEGDIDLLMLDVMLPKLDGVELCRRIRKYSCVPVIMISAKSAEMDKVIALGVGADDYVTKPFSPLELVARVKAQLRRATEFGANGAKKGADDTFGKLVLHPDSYECFVEKQSLELTTKEFQVLYYFAQNRNLVRTKAQIYEAVWDNAFIDESTVTVYINRIRDKLKKFDLDYIKTVWGVGYKFVVEEADE